ncbi:MAG: ABC transporter ATP-binding protein [Candidatus Zixiibacteriota bacterium]
MRLKSRLPTVDFASVRRIFSHFGHYLKAHRVKLITSGVALLGSTLLMLLRPWPIKIVVDFVLMPNQPSLGRDTLSFLTEFEPGTIILFAAVGAVVVAALQGMFEYTHAVLAKAAGLRVIADIRLQLFSHVQRLPLSYHDYRETGDLLTRLTDDIILLEDLLVSTVVQMGSQILLVVGMLTVMFWMDWQLTLVVLAVLPLFLFAAFEFSVRIRESAQRQREMYGKIVTSVQESLAGIGQVKSYAQEKSREKLVGVSVSRDVKANVRTTRLTANYERVVETITAIGTAVVLWLGATKALDGAMSAGDLIIFLSYLRGIYRPLRGMARQSTRVAKATVRGEKILELLEMQPEVQDVEEGLSAKQVKGQIRFERVTFGYDAERPVLRNLDCVIPAGKTSIILGRTGAGKSTIAKLILRLYDVQSGQVWIDGTKIADYRVRSLRKRITPLSQETFLFRTSIADNIGFGKRNATRDEIIAAARTVGADEFIEKLPAGYDTLVGEGGLTLSGGQRQRISFARAALRGSPIMILDEPVTGLDVHTEREAKEVLRMMKDRRTLLIITHRLNFLDLADWVILVEDGRAIAQGSPEELLAESEAYRRFVATADTQTVSPNGAESPAGALHHRNLSWEA